MDKFSDMCENSHAPVGDWSTYCEATNKKDINYSKADLDRILTSAGLK